MNEWLPSAICIQATLIYAWLRRSDAVDSIRRRYYRRIVVAGTLLSLLLVLQTPTISSFVRPVIFDIHDVTGDGVPALLLLIGTVVMGIVHYRAATTDKARSALAALIVLGSLLTLVALAIEPVIYQSIPLRDSFH